MERSGMRGNRSRITLRYIRATRLRRILELRLPAGSSLRDEIEQVPHGAEIVARRERRVGDAHDLLAFAPEYRDARRRAAVGAIAHVLAEGRTLVGDHGKFPAAARGEFLLLLGRIGRGEHEGGAAAQMVVDAIEAIG